MYQVEDDSVETKERGFTSSFVRVKEPKELLDI